MSTSDPSTREISRSSTQITIEDLSKTYNEGKPTAVEAIREIDLTIEDGEFLSVVGPTGCGKTTLLKIIAGLVEKSSGSVSVGGQEVTGPRKEVGVVFQEASLFPWRSVMRNVELGLELDGVPKEVRREQAQDMIDLVGLSGFEHSSPDELSGGMKERTALARTLTTDPEVLLMDEPFGQLDEQTRLRMGGELLRIWRETRKTVLFITHSLQESVLLSDRVAVMSPRPGEITEIIDIDLERPRDPDILGSETFSETQSRIWRILQEQEPG